ncbi:MAG: single-stranded DNA-binding protein [Crenarchaeota archaeon]|nr:single-stranded DNA-binding protein [Thermoproteota archaeon]
MSNSESKVKDLKPGQENVEVKVRVLERKGIKTIRTRAGDRTIGLYTVGDDSGRVTLVAWGSKAASLEAGDSVKISNAWVSSYRGEVQLNIGRSSVIERVDDTEVPQIEEVPEDRPEAPPQAQPRFGSRGGGYQLYTRPRRYRSSRSRR